MKKIILLLICMVSISCLASAQNIEKGATLDTCFQAALKQSEILADQQERVKQAEEHYRQAWALIFPSLNANYTGLGQDNLSGQGTLKISGNIPIFRGFRDLAALNATQNFTAKQKETYKIAALQLYSDASQAFNLVLLLEKDLSILQKEAELLNQRISQLQQRAAIGRSRKTEVLTVQSSLATLIAQQEQVKAQLGSARELLAFLTGVPSTINLDDDQNILSEVVSIDYYLGRIKERPDVKAATIDIEAAKQTVEIARGAFFPSADLGGNYYLNRPQGSLQDTHWDTTLTISQPLFTGGYNLSKFEEANSLLRQSQIALKRVEDVATQNLRSAHQQLQLDLSAVKKFQEALQLSEQNYKAISQDYSYGLVSNLEVLQALTSYQDATRSLNSASFSAKADFNKLQSLAALIQIPEVSKTK